MSNFNLFRTACQPIAQFAHSLHIVCTQFAHRLHTVCTKFVHSLYTLTASVVRYIIYFSLLHPSQGHINKPLTIKQHPKVNIETVMLKKCSGFTEWCMYCCIVSRIDDLLAP